MDTASVRAGRALLRFAVLDFELPFERAMSCLRLVIDAGRMIAASRVAVRRRKS